MKKLFLLCIYGCAGFYSVKAQVVLSPGNSFVQTGGYVVLQGMSLVNNGSFNPAGGTVRFSGAGNNSISGTTSPAFQTLEIGKNTGNQLTLQQNIAINNNINFLSGLIELSGNNIVLNGAAYLNNENETSRITGITGGYVQATATLNAPSSANPGNLGAIISTAQNPGLTVIRRGHVSQQNAYGTGNSIYRYYDIFPTNAPSLFDLRLNYFDAELNGLNEPTLAIWKSNNTLLWLLQNYTSRDATLNYAEYIGINSFNQRWTLSTQDNVLPQLQFAFRASCRTDAVDLSWRITGDNISGVAELQRSTDALQWQTISAVTASASQQYAYSDHPDNPGTFYRVKLAGADGKTVYSEVKSTMCTLATMQASVYPNPATNFLRLQLYNMPDKEVLLTVYTNDGQVVMKRNISITAVYETYSLPLNDLPGGIYHVSLKSPGYRNTLVFVKQ